MARKPSKAARKRLRQKRAAERKLSDAVEAEVARRMATRSTAIPLSDDEPENNEHETTPPVLDTATLMDDFGSDEENAAANHMNREKTDSEEEESSEEERHSAGRKPETSSAEEPEEEEEESSSIQGNPIPGVQGPGTGAAPNGKGFREVGKGEEAGKGFREAGKGEGIGGAQPERAGKGMGVGGKEPKGKGKAGEKGGKAKGVIKGQKKGKHGKGTRDSNPLFAPYSLDELKSSRRMMGWLLRDAPDEGVRHHVRGASDNDDFHQWMSVHEVVYYVSNRLHMQPETILEQLKTDRYYNIYWTEDEPKYVQMARRGKGEPRRGRPMSPVPPAGTNAWD